MRQGCKQSPKKKKKKRKDVVRAEEPSAILRAARGRKAMLNWILHVLSERGTLGGCSDKTMKGLEVAAKAPHRDPSKANGTGFAGLWDTAHF